ncbi:cytochrome P450 [Emericellopsis atlantica]|uniref:Cytochrome P450 n=1 Tax=Emericellopsis atlantica TaxID=2614577 RepID=A0A9P8CW39_9HYPO|nr:cytochrome P450 [Emericellopsis atlantica]KAG9258421.1 cytochrome P450 [Emericellopsis atlantica]
MDKVRQIFSIPGLTVAALAQSLLAIKLFPTYYSSESHLRTVALIFLANYAFGAIFWIFLYPNFFSPLRHLPGQKALVSLAHRTLMVTDRPSGDLFLDLVKQYPDEPLLNLTLTRRQVLVTDPKLLADVLVHKCYDFAKPAKIRNFLHHVLGAGLIVLESDHHKFMRKNTMPAFGFRHIKDLYPMMYQKAETLARALRHETAGQTQTVELSTWASKVTIDIIGVAGMGRKLNVVEKGEDPIQTIYESLLEPSREKLLFSMLSFVLGLPVVRWIPWRMNGIFDQLTGSLNDICMPMIREKRQAIEEKGDDHFDILSLLIKSNNFTDVELKDQLLTFLAAGHETTASALTWACYLLAKHPELQTTLRTEVQAAFPGNPLDDPASLATTLESLPFLNGVIQETLRLYPTVPLTLREAQKDTFVNDQPIPKGTTLVLSMWMTNRSPEIWGPQAGECRPERWINDDGKPNQTGGTSSNYDFLTFLHGPRSCIGQGFAKAEMRCLLAMMVLSFEWQLAMKEEDIMPRGVITIKPAKGMYLKLTALNAGEKATM